MSLTDEQRLRLAKLEVYFATGNESLFEGLHESGWRIDLVNSLEDENEQLRRSLAGRAAEVDRLWSQKVLTQAYKPRPPDSGEAH